MSINSALNCPTCGQSWPDRKGRVCSVCSKPIKLHDKWRFVGATVQHKDCDDPTLAKITVAHQRTFIEEIQA